VALNAWPKLATSERGGRLYRKRKDVENEYASMEKEVNKLIWRDQRRYMDTTVRKS
jgi:hypothetical protein